MKKLFLTLSLLFSVYGNSAVLDITGWNQETGGGGNTRVIITGISSGETIFFTGTAGTVQARRIGAADVDGIGTEQADTFDQPITTNPYAPTWIDEQFVIPYGANGEIDLPPAASYPRASLIILLTGSFTVTVDPNGSEHIFENGASIGAGVADSISGSAGDGFCYYCDGERWIKIKGGLGGITQPITLTADMDADGFDITGAGTISATTLSGDGSAITNLQAPNLTGTIPALSTDTLTTTNARVVTPTAGVSNVIVTTNGNTVIQLDATTETLSMSETPPVGTRFTATLLGHTSDCTVTLDLDDDFYSLGLLGARTEFVVPANKKVRIDFERSTSEYEMVGDYIRIDDLSSETAPSTASLLEVSVGGISKAVSIANIKKSMRVGTKVYGSIASGATGDVTLDWENTDTIIYNVGGTATHTLPLASSLGGPVGLMYQFSASGTITLAPNAADFIRLGATSQSDGVTIVITGTAGETFFVWGDGTNWSTTSGGTADVVPGS